MGARKASKGIDSVRDPYTVKYLKFLCRDLKKTKDFYLTLGATVDWQVKQPITADFAWSAHKSLSSKYQESVLEAEIAARILTKNKTDASTAAGRSETAPKDCDYLITSALSFKFTAPDGTETPGLQLIFECPPEVFLSLNASCFLIHFHSLIIC